MTAQSVSELTNYEYNELYYDSSGPLITGNFVRQVCNLLDKCGVDINITDEYNDEVAKAVSTFQQMIETAETGILTTSLLQAMILYADNMSDVIEDEDEESETTSESLSTSPHFNSFFGDNNYKIHRKNHKDIKIVFGNKSITKTIKDVFMRSVTVEVDTSGNPISEIYEFVARDIIESDEILDSAKYEEDEIKEETKDNNSLISDIGNIIGNIGSYIGNVTENIKDSISKQD